MISGSLTTITGLYASTGGANYNLSKVSVYYDITKTPQGICELSVIGKRRGSEGDLVSGLDESTIRDLCKDFTPGSLVEIRCGISESGGSKGRDEVLFKGYVSAVQDSVYSHVNIFKYSFTVTLSTPEALIPTNAGVLTQTISKDTGSLRLISDAQINRDKREAGQLHLCKELADNIKSLYNVPEINVAEFAAAAIDKYPTSETTSTDLPGSIAAAVDVSSAPRICVPKNASVVASSIATKITEWQSDGNDDWQTFMLILGVFFQIPVINPKTGKFVIKKGLPWSPDVSATIQPSDFTEFEDVHINALNGVFRSVAVNYPAASEAEVDDVVDLSSYYLAAAGYTSSGDPVWISADVGRVSLSGSYIVNGVRITNIRKLVMPSWMYHAGLASNGNVKATKDTWIKWARALATAMVTSSLGARGALRITTRLVPTLDLAEHLGEVVAVDLPTSPPEEGESLHTRKVYGMLQSLKINVILTDDELTAHGEVTLSATRTPAEQRAFCVTSGIFSDEQHRR